MLNSTLPFLVAVIATYIHTCTNTCMHACMHTYIHKQTRRRTDRQTASQTGRQLILAPRCIALYCITSHHTTSPYNVLQLMACARMCARTASVPFMKRLTDACSQSRDSCIEASAEAKQALIYKRDMPWAAPGTSVQSMSRTAVPSCTVVVFWPGDLMIHLMSAAVPATRAARSWIQYAGGVGLGPRAVQTKNYTVAWTNFS